MNKKLLLFTSSNIFKPSQLLHKIAGWYDASDNLTITESSGDVSQWDDKSGNGNHATQAVSSLQPQYNTSSLNGLSLLSFNEDTLEIPTINIKSAMWVWLNLNGNSVDNGTMIFGQNFGGVNNYTFNFANTSDTNYDISIDGGGASSGNASVNGGNLVAGTNIDLGQTNAQNEAENIWYADYNSSISLNLLASAKLGSNFFNSNCDIAEIILLLEIPTNNERQKLEGYLAHKWGLASKLPANHPYKHTQP